MEQNERLKELLEMKPSDLRDLAPKGIGDFRNALVDTNSEMDIDFAREYVERHKTTSYMTNTAISNDTRLVKLAEVIMEDAFNYGREHGKVSDIQIVEWSTIGVVRYKVNGDWIYRRIIVKETVDPLALVFRRLSGVGTENTRVPEIDGSITRVYNKSEAVYRVAFNPNIRSQTVTLRLQDSDSLDMTLDDLGITEDNLHLIKQKINLKNGLILLLGGKGEGKTTTLYAMLLHLLKESNGKKNIMTLENPPEFIVDGIVQSAVDTFVGYRFADGVRVKFREAPDAVLFGEMNDEETVYSAVDMGTGGNITFSSLHGNGTLDVVQVIQNRSKQKVTLDMLGTSLELVIFQSLSKRLCPHCRERMVFTTEERNWITDKLLTDELILEGCELADKETRENCPHCNGTGYEGRVLLIELLDAKSKEFQQELYKQHTDPVEMKKVLVESPYANFYPLEKDVFRRLQAGDISLDQAKELIS